MKYKLPIFKDRKQICHRSIAWDIVISCGVLITLLAPFPRIVITIKCQCAEAPHVYCKWIDAKRYYTKLKSRQQTAPPKAWGWMIDMMMMMEKYATRNATVAQKQQRMKIQTFSLRDVIPDG